MRRLFLIAALSSVAVGCPQAVDAPQDAIRPGGQVNPASQAPSGSLPPPNVGTSDKMDAPPGMDEVPADQKQKAIGALNADAVAIKAAILDYVAKNGQNGSLNFDDGQGGTVTAQFVRTHDPVRYKEGKGYIGLSDFQASSAAANAFYQLAFWTKKNGNDFEVFEVDLQAFPAQRGGEWVRMELFTVNDAFAKPLQ
jgi:hypothetical protein